MIKLISADDVLNIRNIILREGRLQPDECRFTGDDRTDSFHLGYYHKNQLVCVASFHSQNYGSYTGTGYQLRGMATLTEWQGKGLGTQLIKFAVTHLRRQHVNYVWCNARKVAVEFYRKSGFEVISDEFDIPGIGPHYVMYQPIE